ncbi:MAG TPA: hypothetical protein VEB22_01690 [Phycisphaerales bacterium]|nr:hypothetical protein [Phycisphaerales bacterium]
MGIVTLALVALVLSLMSVVAAALVLLNRGRRGFAVFFWGLTGAALVIVATTLAIGLASGQWGDSALPVLLAFGAILGPALIVSVIVAALRAPRPMGRCAACSYDLTATRRDAPCPECGRDQTREVSKLPGGPLR